MTAPPPRSPQRDAAPSDGARSTDLAVTSLLLVALFVLALVFGILSIFGIRDCADFSSGPCNETEVAISAALAPAGLWVIFGISLVVSVVLLTRRKRAFYVPLLGTGAMIICFSMASYLRP